MISTTGVWKRVLPALLVTFACVGPTSVVAQDDEVAGTDEVDTGAPPDHSDIVVDPSLWVLGFNVKKVRSITLLEGPFKGQVFWYMLYTVENPSEESRDAYVSITAVSDRKVSYADTQLTSVEQAVERKVGRPLWGRTDLLEAQKERDPADPAYHYTTFEPGEKRECVAIFNKLDPGANRITISVRGLSNDFHLVVEEDGSRFVEERVFEIDYERPADPYEINLDSFVFKKKEWVRKRVALVIPGEEGESE